MADEHDKNTPGPLQGLKDFYQQNKSATVLLAGAVLVGTGYGLYQGLSTTGTPTPEATATASSSSIIAGTTGTPTPEQTATSAPVSSPSDVPQLSPGNQPQAPTPETDWRPVAEGFAKAWASTEGGRDAWLERLRPYVNDSTYQGFEFTDFDRYIVDKELDQLKVEATGDSSYDKLVAIYYKDNPDTPAVKVILSPVGENFQYQVISVQ